MFSGLYGSGYAFCVKFTTIFILVPPFLENMNTINEYTVEKNFLQLDGQKLFSFPAKNV